MRVNIRFIMKTGIGFLVLLTVCLLLSRQGVWAKTRRSKKNVEKKQSTETPQAAGGGGGGQINLNLNDLTEEGMAAAVKKITDQIKQIGAGGMPKQEPEPEKEVKKEGKKGKIKKPKKESVAGSTTKSKKKAKKQEDKVEKKEEKTVIPKEKKVVEKEEKKSETINLSVVACGDRLEETTVMLKSAVLLTKAPLHFHIFTEPDLRNKFLEKLGSWPEDVRKKFDVTVHKINFPVADADTWKKLFKLCACQRLFLPYILDVELLLYVDTDVLFMRPLDDIWSFFKQFNSTHVAALTPEHEVEWMGWYNRFARHPYYPPFGVNSGVMLMNLTRMREVNWKPKMEEYFATYRYNTTWGDQDLINIFFHFFPEKLLVYPCDWNYRPDHCMYGSTCKPAEEHGAYILHGNRGVFHDDKQPSFKAVYDAIDKYKFGSDMEKTIVNKLKARLESISTGKWKQCAEVPDQFIMELERQVKMKMTAEETKKKDTASDKNKSDKRDEL